MHEFLIRKDEDGPLRKAVDNIDSIREFIDGLAKTKATFPVKAMPKEVRKSVTKEIMEFVGCWPLHDIYGVKSRVFVNPNYIYVHKFTDIVVRCECGAILTRNYKDGDNSLRNEHEHNECCTPYFRLRARADLSQLRHSEMVRLAKMGWTGTEMAPRFGMSPDSIGHEASLFNLTLQELRKLYRRETAETYVYLVRERGLSSKKVGEVYGHEPSTIMSWVREYLDYEYSAAQDTFVTREEIETAMENTAWATSG